MKSSRQKGGAGSSTFSVACASAEFCSNVLQTIAGKKVSTIGLVHLSADKAGGERLTKELGEHLDYFCIDIANGCLRSWTAIIDDHRYIITGWC